MVNNNKQLGLWYGQRLNSFWSSLIALVIMLGSIRGLIVINSDISAGAIYTATAVSLLILATYGYLKSGGYKNANLTVLKNLLKLNMLLGIVNVAIDILLGAPFEPAVLYMYLAPYVVFLFLRVPTRYLNVAIAVITIAISYSVFDNFIETLKGPEGYENVFAYNLKLRPGVFEELSRTGEFYRSAGYTGSYHDSAHILGMSVSFFFIRYLLKNKMLDIGLFLIALLGLTMTQSAANIVFVIFTILIFTCYTLIRSRKMSTYVYLFIGVVGITLLIEVFGDAMGIFTTRISAEGDWAGMKNQLNMNSLLVATPFFLFGHAYVFKSEIITTEVGMLKDIVQMGIIHTIIIYWGLLYPVFRFVKVRSHCYDALPSVAAIFFGFISLLHYGSLFRVTNIFLFYAFYSICLVNIINTHSDLRGNEIK